MKRSRYSVYIWFLCLCCLRLDVNGQQSPVRHVPDSVVSSYRTGKGYEYANDPEYWKKPAEKPTEDNWPFLDKIVNPRLWKLIGYGFLSFLFLFIIYRLYVNGVFYRNQRRRLDAAEGTENVGSLDETALKSLLNDHLKEANYRGAIRTQYLLTLLSLERSGLVKLDANFTNHDYAEQLRSHKTYGSFGLLLKMYEYAWYGAGRISEQDYAYAEKRFADFNKQL